MEAPCFGLFHFFFYREEPFRAHVLLYECIAVEEVADMRFVKSRVNRLLQTSLNVGPIVVADGVQEQVPEAAFFKYIAEYVEDTAFEGFADRFEFGQKLVIHVALSGFLGNEIPQVADFVLSDAVDTSEALFHPVGIPGEVVVDHQVGVLEVHTFPSCVCCHKHADISI